MQETTAAPVKSENRVEVVQVISDTELEYICDASFERVEEAYEHFRKARTVFGVEDQAAPFWVDLYVDGDIVDTFTVADLTAMTGFLPKERATTLAEHQEMASTGRILNAARRAPVEV